jgi:hypothetical protein
LIETKGLTLEAVDRLFSRGAATAGPEQDELSNSGLEAIPEKGMNENNVMEVEKV